MTSFPTEIDLLKRGLTVRSPNIQKLSPFLDTTGLIRVGGRIRHADIPFDARHPLLLPNTGNFVKILILHYHKENSHAPPGALHSILAREFWILSVRRLINNIVFKCLPCYRLNAIAKQPFMGDLPKDRVTAARAFKGVGTDFAGPFYTKVQAVRNRKLVKTYLCIFVCLATKAVHLEVVSDLTTEAFLAALTRFASRRGSPSLIRSDCGRNYVGADNHLIEVHNFLNLNKYTIGSEMAKRNITWIFDPPTTPHWGGLFEAAVKSAKAHLKRVVGDTPLTYEELTTVFTKIEGALNSRPLCPLSPDPNDLQILTPGHLIIGEPLTAIPEYPLQDIKTNKLTRFQLVQQMFQHFWSRWQTEYLCTLQTRPKWASYTDPPAVGDLVLLREDNVPPLEWRRGRIISIRPGKDGVVRVVQVRTATGVLTRPTN
ncbi:uncharacterized protein LOC134655289 [Cydia amplana]|uniref:uncharacterized protein LOC134655289 n=1 Tax=Cydia amplana TaxID=1869771 RepID=UPI002FE642F5